jgi:PAS domain S-box-containing protein
MHLLTGTGSASHPSRGAGPDVPRVPGVPSRESPGAPGRREAPALSSPVGRVVAGVVLAGTVAVAFVLGGPPQLGAAEPLFRLCWLTGPALAVCLAALTCAGELVAVRLHHRDVVEELTLIDPVVLLDVLLLPSRQAIEVCLAGLVLAYVIRRRALVKALFNLGTYAAAGSVLIVLLRVCVGSSAAFDGRLVVALAVGASGFVAVNLLFMSMLCSALGAGSVLALVRQDLHLSVLTMTATLALTITVTVIAVHAAVFLPFAVLPAAAITYAYRATATEIEERQRSALVLAFSQILAGSPDRELAVGGFLRLARQGFFADEVLAVFDNQEVLTLTGDDAPAPRSLPFGPDHARLLAAAAGGAVVVRQNLPSGWSGALLAPLEADGTRTGVVAVGWRGRHRLHSSDLILLTPLASALAVGLASARYLAQLLAESSKVRAVVEQSSDGILVLDGDGVVQLWNPALVRLAGCGEGDAVGRPLGALLSAEGLDGQPLDAFETGRRELTPDNPEAVVDLVVVRPDGDRRSVRCAHAATFDTTGVLVRDVVNVHDLTRERQLEKLKSDFVATVSHELRTPVTPIRGYAELLLRRGDSLPPDKRVRALEVIVDRAGHLARLVEDLLLASRISDDAEPVRSVVLGDADLAALAGRACEDFGADVGRLNLTVPAEPVTVVCDSTRTIQVLTNLVSNALKYSSAETVVDVEVRADGEYGQVAVTDRGRGLPSGELEQIFDKFHRVEDPMVTSTGGTGLGLYIARHLALAMQGDLTVTSRLGVGSTFTFRIPMAAS